MNVKQLKQILADVSDNDEVTVTIDNKHMYCPGILIDRIAKDNGITIVCAEKRELLTNTICKLNNI